MKLSAPKFSTWFIALLFGAAGILMRLGVMHVSGINQYAFWLVTAGFGLLVIGTLFRKI